MTIDISWLNEGLPIFSFVLIFVLVYAVLAKTKVLGESKSINAVLSLILSIIFITFSSVREFIVNATVWFSVILTFVFFFLLILFFIIKEPDKFLKPLAIIFLILMALTLVIIAFYSFPSTHAYLPGQSEAGANEFLLSIKHFILEKEFLSGILLLVIAIIVAFIITR